MSPIISGAAGGPPPALAERFLRESAVIEDRSIVHLVDDTIRGQAPPQNGAPVTTAGTRGVW
jgi:hypothetical protein